MGNCCSIGLGSNFDIDVDSHSWDILPIYSIGHLKIKQTEQTIGKKI